jgi:mutual gliding-motility protein MglA
MHLDWKNQEIIFKIVYYGPGLGGKTTNLEHIYATIKPSLRSKLVSFKTKEDRTLYFDFLQVGLAPINGKKPRFHLYTIPGQVQYSYGRKLVIKGADAIVFVADSQRDRLDENVASMQDLQEKLAVYNKSLNDQPWIIQYNKRDVPRAASVESLQRELNPFGVPHFEAVATQGAGVFETLKSVIQMAMRKL